MVAAGRPPDHGNGRQHLQLPRRGQSYETGNLLDAGWIAAYLAIAVGAFCSDARSALARTTETSSPTLGPMLAPFIPMFVALSVVGIETQLGHRPDPVAATMAFALVALVLVRQALLMLDLITSSGDRHGSVAMRLYSALLDAMPDSTPENQRRRPAPSRVSRTGFRGDRVSWVPTLVI